MTIEIKQLVIRAVAEANPTARPGLSGRSANPTELRGSAKGPTETQPHPAALADQREAIVAACVREVLRKLERSRER